MIENYVVSLKLGAMLRSRVDLDLGPHFSDYQLPVFPYPEQIVIGNGPFRCGAGANKMRRGLINGAINREAKHPIPDSTEQMRKIPILPSIFLSDLMRSSSQGTVYLDAKRTAAADGRQVAFYKLKTCARAITLGKVPFFGSFFGHARLNDTVGQAKNEQINLSRQILFQSKRFGHI